MHRIYLILSLCLLSACYALADDVYVVTASELNIRTAPNKKARAEYVAPKGTEVIVVGFTKDSSWAHIKDYGWASAKYLKYSRPYVKPPRKTPKKQFDRIMQVLLYIGSGLGMFFFVIFLIPAVKRWRILAHLFGLGLSTAILFVMAYYEWYNPSFLFFIGPFLTILLWPLLYLRQKSKTLTNISVVALLISAIFAYAMFKLSDINTVLSIIFTLLLVGAHAAYVMAAYLGQLEYICPHCHYYARGYVRDREYTGSTFRTEDTPDERYDHSELVGDTLTHYYERTHTYSHYEDEHYDLSIECPNCKKQYIREKIVTKFLGSHSTG